MQSDSNCYSVFKRKIGAMILNFRNILSDVYFRFISLSIKNFSSNLRIREVYDKPMPLFDTNKRKPLTKLTRIKSQGRIPTLIYSIM